MEKYKGKLDTIYYNPIIQDYIQDDVVFGYHGHGNRTDKTDILLEKALKDSFISQLIDEDMISEWICSKTARHFMDLCEDEEYFKENVLESIMEF
jgi:hypothetical protein